MALSKRTRKALRSAIGSKKKAKEIANAIDVEQSTEPIMQYDIEMLEADQSLLKQIVSSNSDFAARDRQGLQAKADKMEEDLASSESRVSLLEAQMASHKAASTQQHCQMHSKSEQLHASGEDREARLSLVEVSKATKMAAIATADIAAAPASYDQAHMDTIVALLNEIKAALNLMNS